MRQRLVNDMEPIMGVSDELNLKAKTIGKQICGEQTKKIKEAKSLRPEAEEGAGNSGTLS